jgi:peptidoglycan/LPS O-acetylase OafA/YrhL
LLSVLYLLLALIVLGAFWRYALRGLFLITVLVAIILMSVALWRHFITEPAAAEKQNVACVSFMREHPGFIHAAKDAKSFTYEQAIDPCPQQP